MTTPITGQGLNVCIPPDDELSLTSKKAAQNKVITEELTDLSNAISQKAPIIINTASGAIASFTDGADDMPVKQIVAQVEPVQDLHGYDFPWPAGGGKNLYNPDNRTETSDNTYYVTELLPNTQYTFSVDAVQSGLYVAYDNDGTWESLTAAYNTDTLSFNTGEHTRIRLTTYKTGSQSIPTKYQLELGSTATAYAPYSNICPISGHTGCDITGTGKNLFDDSNADWKGSYYINNSGGESSNSNYKYSQAYTKVKSGQTYTIQYYKGTTKSAGCTIACYDANMAFKTRLSGVTETTDTGNMSGQFEVPADVVFIRLNMPRDDTTNVQLTEAAAASAYEQFGTTIPITFPDAAGTVYGASLTVNEDGSGVLAVTMAGLDLGTKTWNHPTPGGRFYAEQSGMNVPSNTETWLPNWYCSNYKVENYNNLSSDFCIYALNKTQISIKDSRYDTVEAFTAAMSGVYLVYELATPLTPINLTALQVLETLYGANNVWCDTGDISVDYRADTKLYIDNKITQAIAAALNS